MGSCDVDFEKNSLFGQAFGQNNGENRFPALAFWP